LVFYQNYSELSTVFSTNLKIFIYSQIFLRF